MVKEIKNYNENEVVEMKNTEKVIVNNSERGNEVMSNFDMNMVVKYVVKAIKDSEGDIRELKYALTYDNMEIMTEQEQEYCAKLLHYMELAGTMDFVKDLYNAEGTDIFEVVAKLNSWLGYSDNPTFYDQDVTMRNLETEIKYEYALYKLPILKDLLDSFFEWYKSEINYDYALSDLMAVLECGDRVTMDGFILYYIENAIAESDLSDFTDYEDDSIEGIAWDNFKIIVGFEYIEKNFEDNLYEFKREFLDRFM